MLEDLITIPTAAFLIPLLTAGRAKVVFGDTAVGLPWYQVRRSGNGIWHVGDQAAAIIGTVFWAAVIFVVLTALR